MTNDQFYTDSGLTTYYNQEGNKICEIGWFIGDIQECEIKFKELNLVYDDTKSNENWKRLCNNRK